MCGIAGIRRYTEKPIPREMIETLLICSERRGNDATGIALQREKDPKIHGLKGRMPASEFLLKDIYKKFAETFFDASLQTVILHTRLATCGTPEDNRNNHPLWSEDSAIVHNGCISNHDWLFRDLKLERTAETDSDILRAIVDKKGFTEEAIRMLCRVSGSVAMAAISMKHPGKLLVARSGSPVCFACNDDFLMFASEKEFLYNALRPWKQKWGVDWRQVKTDGLYTTMPSDTAWIFGKDGLEWHQHFNTSNFTGNAYRNSRDTYYARNSKWQGPKNIQSLVEASVELSKSRCDTSGCSYEKDKKLVIVGHSHEIPRRREFCNTCHAFVEIPKECLGMPNSQLYCIDCRHYLDESGKVAPKEN